MRRLLAAAVLGGSLLLAATACTATSTPSATGASTPSPTVAWTPNPTYAANDNEVCHSAEKVIADNTATFAAQLAGAMTQASQGTDEKTRSAIAALKATLAAWSTGLRDQATKAQDPDLKSALTTMADGFADAGAKINTAQDIVNAETLISSEQTQAASEKVTEICGNYLK